MDEGEGDVPSRLPCGFGERLGVEIGQRDLSFGLLSITTSQARRKNVRLQIDHHSHRKSNKIIEEDIPDHCQDEGTSRQWLRMEW